MYPDDFVAMEAKNFHDVSNIENIFDKVQRVNEKILRYLRKYACFFGDLCIQHLSIMRYRYSILSACCLAAARKALNLAVVWSPELEQMTKVK